MKAFILTPLLLLIGLFISVSSIFAQHTKLETVVQLGHSASVKAVAVSPNGKYLATGSRDKTAKLWDIQTGMEIRTFLGHEHTINAIVFNPDGKLIATSSADNTASVWDITNGKRLFTTPKEMDYMTDIDFSPDGKQILCAGYNDSANVYDIKTGAKITSVKVNPDQGSGYGISVKYSPDHKWAAIGQDNKVADLYQLPEWKLAYTLKAPDGWCGGCGTFVTFSKDSRYVVKMSHRTGAEQYDLQTGNLVRTYGENIDNIVAINFSHDNKKLLVAGDKQLIQYDTKSGAILSSIKLDSLGEFNDAVYNSTSSSILLAFGSNKALSINALTLKEEVRFSGIINQQDKGGINYNPDNYYDSYISKYLRLKNTLLLSNDDQYFFTGKSGTTAIKWNIGSGKPELSYQGHSKAVICFDLSADGALLLTGDGSGEAILWETATGKKIRSFIGHRDPIFEVKISPNGNSITTTSWDAKIIVWDIQTAEKLSVIDLRNSSAYNLSYSPDGLYLITGRFDKSLELWEPDSKNVVRTFIGHTDIVSSISFGPDRYKMLSASWDGSARIWNIATGMMTQKFKVSNTALHTALFTPDGTKIITGGDDRVIRIYDISTGKLLQKLEGHQAEVTSIKISKDGKMLVSYSLDGVIKCWNLEKGIEFYEHMHLNERDWMARTTQGYFNATSGARNAIHFVKGLEVYNPEQFFEEYYRPDLIPELYKNRGSNPERQKIEDKLNQSPPPTIKLAVVALEGDTSAEVHMKIINNGGGINEIRLTHNGKTIPIAEHLLDFPSKNGASTTLKQTFPLLAGPNIFSAVGISKGRIESSPSQATIISENAANESTCHIFAVGIDKYKNPSMSLNYARADAEAFAETLSSRTGKLFKKTVTHTLYDEDATKQSLLDTLEALSKTIAPHDVFVFYYAGHGSMTEGKFYFITQECTRLYDQGNLDKNAVSSIEIQEKLSRIKALKQIIIMDACQSGGSVEVLAMRGSLEEKAIAQLSRSAGIHVLASAGGEQNAKEISQLGHGLFTYVLLKALKGEADGSPNDGKITIYELKSFLDDQVPELNKEYSGKIQYPYTFSRGHDFPIVFE